MAAALHARILAEGYTPGMLRAAGMVVPKGPDSYAQIFNWEEEEDVSPCEISRGAEYREHQYLRHGGIYESRVLSKCREMAQQMKNDGYRRTMNDPRFVNEAPQWPPSADLVFNPPQWGAEIAPPPFDPFQEDEGDVQCPAPQSAKICGLAESSPLEHNSKTIASSTATPGFFIGRDGTQWPLPPAEFMPTAPIHPPGLQRGHRALPERVASSDRSDDPKSRDRDGHTHGSPQTTSGSSPASSSVGLVTPENKSEPIFSYRPDPRAGVIGEGRPKHGGRMSSKVAKEKSFAGGHTNALGLDLYAFRDVGTRKSSRDTDPEVGFFRGRDGNWWPLPPMEVLLASVGHVHRGRNPVPKW
ncbi:hypothetical protein C8Q74DRAFT_1366496 [Fomes fomentarius]|nr:hypothetical protein C8Q74DRAFT_1366496 [Fomes fomentarius]